MKCPRCGSEMHVDSHRKYDLHMCYNCGYIEGRSYGEGEGKAGVGHKLTNFERLRYMNENEAIAFISSGMNMHSANASAGTLQNVRTKASSAPIP